jgi:hypothetical protein
VRDKGIEKMSRIEVEAKAEIFLLALQSLTKAERDAVVNRLLEDPELREDIVDIALMEKRKNEPSRLFREYLAEKGKKAKH